MFKEMGVRKIYIGKSLDDLQRVTAIFQGPENLPYDIFVNTETKPIFEASGHIYLCGDQNKLVGFLEKINLL